MPKPSPAPLEPPRLQRASGECRVAFDLRGGETRLGDLYQRDPCRVLFPKPELGEPPQAVLLTTSGGVTDGDTLKMAIEIGPGATAVATTQAAEKIYRAAKGGGHCAIDVAVRVGEGASLDWLPQETIVFQGARLKRRTVADVEPGGALLACEMVVLGRAASGERFVSGLLLELLVGAPDRSARLDRHAQGRGRDARRRGLRRGQCAGHGDRRVGCAPAAVREGARAPREVPASVRAGVTLVNGVMVARLLGEATAVRGAAIRFLTDFRGHRLPRVWHV